MSYPSFSSQQNQTVELTTDPSTFYAEQVFDLGRSASITWTTTLLGITPDGELFDSTHLGVGNYDLGGNGPCFYSLDGSTFYVAGAFAPSLSHAFTVGDIGWASLVIPRYLKVPVSIVDSTAILYAGANHPSVDVRIDLEYV